MRGWKYLSPQQPESGVVTPRGRTRYPHLWFLSWWLGCWKEEVQGERHYVHQSMGVESGQYLCLFNFFCFLCLFNIFKARTNWSSGAQIRSYSNFTNWNLYIKKFSFVCRTENLVVRWFKKKKTLVRTGLLENEKIYIYFCYAKWLNYYL